MILEHSPGHVTPGPVQTLRRLGFGGKEQIVHRRAVQFAGHRFLEQTRRGKEIELIQ
jgi:hypothetical protein